jgi:hypothetical protein
MRTHSQGNYKKDFFTRVSVLIFLSVFIAGCSANRDVVTKSFYKEGELSLNRIAIVPFQRVISEDPSVTFVQCPICNTILRTCEFAGNPEKHIEEIFTNKVRSRGRYIIVPSERAKGVYKRVSSSSFKASPRKILQEVGKELGVDGIIIGYVFCYRERKGYTYSVEKPASVTFSAHLLRVEDGALLWRGIFDKTQSSLMENLLDIAFFVKEGGKWVTAEKLSEEGVEGILQTFPGLQ